MRIGSKLPGIDMRADHRNFMRIRAFGNQCRLRFLCHGDDVIEFPAGPLFIFFSSADTFIVIGNGLPHGRDDAAHPASFFRFQALLGIAKVCLGGMGDIISPEFMFQPIQIVRINQKPIKNRHFVREIRQVHRRGKFDNRK